MKANARDWKYFDQRLTELRKRDVATIIERGQVLIEAKDELGHGSWTATVERHFDLKTAQRLMKITRHPVLSKGSYTTLLPPFWYTLYLLTQLPDELLVARVEDKTIHPRMEQKAATALVKEFKSKKLIEPKQPPSPKKTKSESEPPPVKRALAVFDKFAGMLVESERVELIREMMRRWKIDAAQLQQDKPAKLEWQLDKKYSMDNHPAYLAGDYAVSPGQRMQVGSSAPAYVGYAVFFGDQKLPQPDRECIGQTKTVTQAKALAQRHYDKGK